MNWKVRACCCLHGRMLLSLVISFFIQSLSLIKEISWFYQPSLAELMDFLEWMWLSDSGRIKPFGDIEQLIKLGCLTQQISLVSGLLLFTLGVLCTVENFLQRFLNYFLLRNKQNSNYNLLDTSSRLRFEDLSK